jgi:hypothetical protein
VSKILVTAGNVNEQNFYGVCYAVKQIVKDIDIVYIFDTIKSAEKAETTQRNLEMRNIFGSIEITTLIVDEDDIQTVIPHRLSRLIREYGASNIVVDLSNGQKIVTAVLYAVSTISRLPNIYHLLLQVFDRKRTVQEMKHGEEWDYVKIQPLEEVLNITKNSQVELIYYRDRIEHVTNALITLNAPFANDVKIRLEHSLVDYFTISSTDEQDSERLERCINGLGKICEDVSIIWHDFCIQKDIIQSQAKDFSSRVKQIISKWESYRRDLSSNKSYISSDVIVSGTVLPTLVLDVQLETMRVYRNLASHSVSYYQFKRHDARLTLDMTLLILERLSQSDILKPTTTNDEQQS